MRKPPELQKPLRAGTLRKDQRSKYPPHRFRRLNVPTITGRWVCRDCGAETVYPIVIPKSTAKMTP